MFNIDIYIYLFFIYVYIYLYLYLCPHLFICTFINFLISDTKHHFPLNASKSTV